MLDSMGQPCKKQPFFQLFLSTHTCTLSRLLLSREDSLILPALSRTYTPLSDRWSWSDAHTWIKTSRQLERKLDGNGNKNTAHHLECDTACSPSMIWMLNAKWHMHEHGTWGTNWQWDYNATTTAKKNVTWIVKQAACVVHDCFVCDSSGITRLYKHLHRDCKTCLMAIKILSECNQILKHVKL